MQNRKHADSGHVKVASEEAQKQKGAGHLLLLSCALLLWSVRLGDVGSAESPLGSVSERTSALLPPSRDASSSGRETHLRLLPSDGCTPKTQLEGCGFTLG